jgi:hypothetical protein
MAYRVLLCAMLFALCVIIKETRKMKSENYRTTTREIDGVKINLTSYKIGEQFYCHVTNLDPGATIARAEATTSQEDAEQIALAKALERLRRK